MIKHIQDQLYNANDEIPRGSCYPTVLACLLDLSVNEVPYFHLLYFKTEKEKEGLRKYAEKTFLNGMEYNEYFSKNAEDSNVQNYERWIFDRTYWLWDNVREAWLASKGYKEQSVLAGNMEAWLVENPTQPYMVSGISPRGVQHVVIHINGKLEHDPHPDGGDVFETETDKFSYSYLKPI